MLPSKSSQAMKPGKERDQTSNEAEETIQCWEGKVRQVGNRWHANS
jgi:hypothetical protein